MSPVATAVTVGCLDALRWLLWLIAILLVALVIVQFIRNDEAAQPLQFLAVAIVGTAGGWLCGLLSRRLLAAN
jgi:hypothetical protein